MSSLVGSLKSNPINANVAIPAQSDYDDTELRELIAETLVEAKGYTDTQVADKVDKELKTGSEVEYKVLSDNNLTDELLIEINNAVHDSNYVHTDNNYTNSDAAKLSGIEQGAEVNIIEDIQVNGASLEVIEKAVNIIMPENTSDLINDGDGTPGSEYATTTYVDENGGKIDTIEVNGVAQTITNKTVNITVPTNTNQLTNGAGYQTSSDVSNAIDAKISSTYKAKGSCTFASKPSLTSTHEGEVWNISDGFTTTADFVEGAGLTYPAGTNIVVINASSTSTPDWKYDVLAGFVDLTNYLTSSDVIALNNDEIDSVCV